MKKRSDARRVIRLAIIVSHPIQYQVPLYRALAATQDIELMVFFTWGDAEAGRFDRGFEQEISWDIPLLEEYAHRFVATRSRDAGTHHFWGLVNPTLFAQVIAWRSDVVLLNGYNYFSYVTFAYRFSRYPVPLLFRGESHLLSPRSWVERTVKKQFLTSFFGHFSACLYCGTLSRQYFREYSVPEEKLFHCPHVVDNLRFMGGDERLGAEAQRWRERLGIGSEELVILFAGKLQHKKDPQNLLAAFRQAMLDKLTLLHVGNGELEEPLKAEASGQGVKVLFLPFQNQSQMPLVYRLGDIFVLPSVWDETSGLAVNEAMSCGLPVIAGDQVGCAPDLVVAGTTGWVYPAGDVASLSACLSRACANRDIIHAYGKNAKRLIDDWNLDAVAGGIVDCCRAVSHRR